MIHKTLSSFWHLSRTNKLLILQTAVTLSITQLLVQFIPFRWLSTWLGHLNQESDFSISPEQLGEVRRARWAVRRMSAVLPWQSTCLTRAITAKFLMSLQQIDTTLYLGATFTDEKKLEAHAWLRCGEVYITGGAERNAFCCLASYS